MIVLIPPQIIKPTLKTSLLTTNTQVDTHYHAGFLVYIDGQLQNFALEKYMNKSNMVCKTPEKSPTAAENQQEKAHLHDNIGNVVHVHRIGAI